MTDETTKLKRLLYITNTESQYIAGNPEEHFLKNSESHIELVANVVKESEQKLIELLKQANDDELLPRRVTLLYVLAYSLTRVELPNNAEARMNLARAALSICKNDEEFFKFISLFTQLNNFNNKKNKITTSMGRVVKKFLENKTPVEYAQSVSRAKGYHGWSFKDLIKLSHYKSESVEKAFVTTYVLYGWQKVEELQTEQTAEVAEILKKWNNYKQASDPVAAAALVKELNVDSFNITSKFIQDQYVWSSIISKMSVRDVLKNLTRFYRMGMLRINCKVYMSVVEALSSLPRIKACNLEPIEVFIHLKDFAKGGKPVDPKLQEYLRNFDRKGRPRVEPRSPTVTTAIMKCLKDTYSKDPHSLGTGKKIILALDVTQQSEKSELSCFKKKNVTCLEAQLALSLYFHKTEKNTIINVFNNKDIKAFNLDKNASFAQSLKKLEENKSDYLLFPNIFNWAISKKKEVDIFICFLQNMKSLNTAPKEVRFPGWNSIKDGFLKYQQKMSSPHTKLVVICPGAHDLPGFDGINSLSVCGFCPEIVKVIKGFIQGSFS